MVVAMHDLHSPEHWLIRAREARQTAANLSDAAARQAMLAIADNYEKIAKRSEAREVGIGVSGQRQVG